VCDELKTERLLLLLMTEATQLAVRKLGFSCAPTDEEHALRASLTSLVPNRQARELLKSYAVFSSDSSRAQLVRRRVAGVVGDEKRENRMARKLALEMAAQPGETVIVRIPFTARLVRVET